MYEKMELCHCCTVLMALKVALLRKSAPKQRVDECRGEAIHHHGRKDRRHQKEKATSCVTPKEGFEIGKEIQQEDL